MRTHLLRAVRPNGRRSMSTVPLMINNKDVITTTTAPTISPLTNKPVWSFSSASDAHVEEAVQSCQAAFPAWSKTKVCHRRDLLLSCADIVARRKTELGGYMHHEIGADEGYQDFILGLTIDGFRDTAGRIAGAVTGTVPESNLPGMRAMVLKRPYGVNVGIAPWNAPYHLGLRSVLFAIAAGNTAILKGSEFTPRCYYAIADIFREAGLPDGVLNLILHAPQDGPRVMDKLVTHEHVKKINFTGSTRVGSIIAKKAGEHLKPVLMELGGKASAIVLEDADLEKAALQCALGAFLNAGQICMSTERVLVHESIAADFEKVLAATIRNVFGTPETTPVLISASSAHRNRDLVGDAVTKGARSMDILGAPASQVETRMQPIVLQGVREDMDLYQTESFGPSTSLFTFKTDAEAISLANNTAYGLSAAVFTKDLNRAFKVAEELESGAVHINSMTVHDEYTLPHGGVKKSGFGRFNGYQGMDEFLYYKTVTWQE
ncbi:putative aldehyde dehydrogenase [Emericellopsis atlantica]|uniref:Aldehyde dehydrogenase n=1 Tax=Emericellopsis atlantica TaxID=2614577 RepID=A0A9P8CNE6_9HYPO|nr:putative aldehyde dehydrogenase [Emericellopsis atlantica]KAG9252975.1 putative aldehyde dehydrogenase [Emericellopsis atlantica]